jgi:hypothetical protein
MSTVYVVQSEGLSHTTYVPVVIFEGAKGRTRHALVDSCNETVVAYPKKNVILFLRSVLTRDSDLAAVMINWKSRVNVPESMQQSFQPVAVESETTSVEDILQCMRGAQTVDANIPMGISNESAETQPEFMRDANLYADSKDLAIARLQCEARALRKALTCAVDTVLHAVNELIENKAHNLELQKVVASYKESSTHT